MFVSCTSLQKVYENLSKIVAPTALFSLASAKVEQDFILTKDFRGKFKKKRFFGELEGARLTEWLLRVAKIAIKKGIWKERGGTATCRSAANGGDGGREENYWCPEYISLFKIFCESL